MAVGLPDSYRFRSQKSVHPIFTEFAVQVPNKETIAKLNILYLIFTKLAV